MPQANPNSTNPHHDHEPKMNGLSFSEVFCLFCCPPCPGRIAAKLAFLPPEPTYKIEPISTSPNKFKFTLSDRAEWQHTSRELECFEAFFTQSSRGNRIACMFFIYLFVFLSFYFTLLCLLTFVCFLRYTRSSNRKSSFHNIILTWQCC